MSLFDTETAVQRIDDNRWSAHVSRSWNIGDNPNGGYLVAIALQAVRQLGPHPDPITVTAHFLRPGTGDAPAEVHTQLIRTGRTVTTSRATLIQEGKARVELIAAYSDLGASSGLEASLSVAPPPMPPPEECMARSAQEQGVGLELASRVETRIHPAQAMAGQAGAAEVSGWIRFVDDRPPESHGAVLFADAFPPSVFGLLGRIGWVPTIELTVHLRRRPTPGWILGRFATQDLHDGRMIEDGMLWDETGALVAQCRQIGLLLSETAE